jgi:hypothetical protein
MEVDMSDEMTTKLAEAREAMVEFQSTLVTEDSHDIADFRIKRTVVPEATYSTLPEDQREMGEKKDGTIVYYRIQHRPVLANGIPLDQRAILCSKVGRQHLEMGNPMLAAAEFEESKAAIELLEGIDASSETKGMDIYIPDGKKAGQTFTKKKKK